MLCYFNTCILKEGTLEGGQMQVVALSMLALFLQIFDDPFRIFSPSVHKQKRSLDELEAYLVG
jgi:hypothetical protein